MGARVPITELLLRLREGKRLLGLSVTHATSEVAMIQPPYQCATLVRTGKMLDEYELQAVAIEHAASALVLGGSAAFRADGSAHFGVRKLISRLTGVEYRSEWLPVRASDASLITVLVSRDGQDDPCEMLVQFIRTHAAEEIGPLVPPTPPPK